MTGTYTAAGFTNGRPVVFIGQTSVPHGQPNDWTVEPSSPGAVIYRINGGAWHQLTAQSTEFTLAQGADIDLRYNDAIGGYVDDDSDRPSTVNSGHYDIVVTRSK